MLSCRFVSRRMLSGLTGRKSFNVALRLAVGIVLLFSCHNKLLDSTHFAKAIAEYRLLPLPLASDLAVILPWIEFVVGVCLLIGLETPGASSLAVALCGVFEVALVSALIRRLDIACGCFVSEASRISWLDVALRGCLLLAALEVARAPAPAVDWPLSVVLRRPAGRSRT